MIRGMGWSFSAHAKDIWTTPEWELRRKIADAAWGVTCTRTNLDYLRSLTEAPRKIDLVYHGLDFSRFPPAPQRPAKRNGAFTIVSVGRAVEKKGYADLLRALAMLGMGRNWRFEHAGGGALSKQLKQQAARLGIADRITWHGAQDRDFIFGILKRADLFALPSRLARSGDRDGLPNVLMEAQAFAVPVLATNVSGIPELIAHGKTGLLVAERDPHALADAMRHLMDDNELRLRLAKAGAKNVREKFSSEPGIDFVAAKLKASRARRKAA
jgi:glycosyltransferase involved in cell wall biosynthesis